MNRADSPMKKVRSVHVNHDPTTTIGARVHPPDPPPGSPLTRTLSPLPGARIQKDNESSSEADGGVSP